ncbi:MAG TPA: G5 domain-containing protein [Armatimonadota bacterium]|nr:G5 domain-containing protein [Armatimonadota bacterium]
MDQDGYDLRPTSATSAAVDRPARRFRRQLIIERAIGIPLIIVLVYWVAALKSAGGRACFIEVGEDDAQIRIAVDGEDSAERVLTRLRQSYGGSLPPDSVQFRPKPSLHMARLGRERLLTVDEAVKTLGQAIESGQIEVVTKAAVVYVNGRPLLAVRSPAEVDAVMEGLKKRAIEDIAPENVVEQPRILEKITYQEETRAPKSIMTSREEAEKRLLDVAQKAVEDWVGPDDTLERYLAKYSISRARLQELNPKLDLEHLKLGDHVLIRRARSYVTVEYKVRERRTEPIPFEEEKRPSAELSPGQTKVIQEGKPGQADVEYLTTYHNGDPVERIELSRRVLYTPTKRITMTGPPAPGER